MKLLSSAIAAAAILLAAGSTAAQTSQKITAGKASDYGLTYALPLTALDIYLEAEISEQTPGEFYNYARRHLGISDAVTTPSRSARLKSVTIVPRGVADADNRWTAQFKPGTSASMTLTPEGLPLAINTDATTSAEKPAIPAARPSSPSPLEGPAATQAVTQEMARSASTSKKAELAAQRIFELRETRSDILSGQADNPPADGAAMKLVLDNLAAQEAALTAMFAGVTSDRTVVEKITILPDSAETNDQIIARLSAVDGILAADNLAGAPVTLDIRILERATLPLTEKGEPKTFPKGGVAYRIPGRALVTVSFAGTPVASQEVDLAQLGVVFGLNPTLFTDKKEPYYVTFDTTTGAPLKLAPLTSE